MAEKNSQQRPLNEQELQRLAVSTSQVGANEMMLAAMLAKQVQGSLNEIKHQARGVGDLKVSDVDMSKVMPSAIMKATGMQVPQQRQMPVQAVPNQPLAVQPSIQPVTLPPATWSQPPGGPGSFPPEPRFEQTVTLPTADPNQLEFDLNRQARYEDIINAIDKLENKINILTDKVNILIDSNNKKKPKITNGT